jgi:hypothetical protein
MDTRLAVGRRRAFIKHIALVFRTLGHAPFKDVVFLPELQYLTIDGWEVKLLVFGIFLHDNSPLSPLLKREGEEDLE